MKIIRFTSANKNLLDKAFRIREKVFIDEQKVERAEEFDAFEESSVHFLLSNDKGPQGTARWRITNEGIKLERFAVLEENRGLGYGNALLKAVLNDIPRSQSIYLHAQVSVLEFYEKQGFLKTGPMFSECNIDHYKMTLASVKKLTFQECIGFVEEFHNSFRLPVNCRPTVELDASLIELRHRLMHEENEEYLEAARDGDLVEVADALGDMLYILCGTILSHGMQDKIEEVYREIQRSNLSKLDADGNPIYRKDGKVMKSDQYFKPDIETILKA